jgi:hypothetical protein
MLTQPIAGRERDWSVSVAQVLQDLENELHRRRLRNQGREGFFPALDATRPTLFRQWSELCQEARKLAAEVQGLRLEIEQGGDVFQSTKERLEAAATPPASMPVGGAVPVFSELRRKIESLFTRLDKNLETEHAVLLESVTTDIGVGD